MGLVWVNITYYREEGPARRGVCPHGGNEGGRDYAQSSLPGRFWIVSSISARVNGLEITASTAELFLDKTFPLPAPVMMTNVVRGQHFGKKDSKGMIIVND